MPELSVIVPVYNSEQTIKRCLESILCQNYKDYELILIDDGSTDLSGRICDYYQNRNSRIKVWHQANVGVSCARNKGIEIANGNYVTFIDADDTVAPLFLDTGMKYMQSAKRELFICGYERIGNNKRINNCISHDVSGRLYDLSESTILELLKANYMAQCWGKIYKRQLIDNTRFDPSMKFGEDLCFNIEIIKKNPEIIAINESLYFYMMSDNSLTQNTDIWKCKNVVETYHMLYDTCTFLRFSEEGDYVKYIDKRWTEDFLVLERMILMDKSSMIEKYKRIRVLLKDKYLKKRLLQKKGNYIEHALKPGKQIIANYLHQKRNKK